MGGDPLSITGQQISFNYNELNLKIEGHKLNTVQDIATTSMPTFTGLELKAFTKLYFDGE